MIDKHAKLLWEDVLNNGKGDNVITKFNINREEVRIFLAHTKPEMFVSKELNKMSLLEIKKLKQKAKTISNDINEKKSSSLILNIMFVFYFIMIFPILALIIFIKYIFY